MNDGKMDMSIPSLQSGQLPHGVHCVSVDEIEQTFGARTARRRWLMSGLKAALTQFKRAGVPFVLIDGSFTTDKDEPGDIDGCWSALGDLDLEQMDSDFWDFQDNARFQICRTRVRLKYGLDFFIAENAESISGKPFSEFFQINRDGSVKGILKVILNEEPR